MFVRVLLLILPFIREVSKSSAGVKTGNTKVYDKSMVTFNVMLFILFIYATETGYMLKSNLTTLEKQSAQLKVDKSELQLTTESLRILITTQNDQIAVQTKLITHYSGYLVELRDKNQTCSTEAYDLAIDLKVCERGN